MPDLDYLVIAPHPDDAELGVGGTILLLKAQGSRVGVLDLTDGEPTPHGSPEIRRRETEAATRRPRPGLARQPRACPTARWSPTWQARAPPGRRPARAAAARPVRPLLGRRPSRSRRRQRPGRCRPLLGEAHQDRPARPAALPRAHRLLLQRPPAHPAAGRRSSWTSRRSTRRRCGPLACYHSQFIEGRPTDAADLPRRPARPGPLLGLGDRRRLRRAVPDAGGSGSA